MSLVRRIAGSHLVRGGILIFIANNIASFGNFLFNLIMGRFLSPDDYGNLGAVMSLLVLLGVPLSIFNLTIVKVISSAFGKGRLGEVALLLRKLTPKLFILGMIAVAVILGLSNQLTSYLHLTDNTPILILALFFLLSFPAVFNRAILQGVLSFHFITINSFVEITLKLIVSTVLVLLNFGLLGALAGPLLGGLAGYILTVIELKVIFGKKAVGAKRDGLSFSLWKTAVPVFFATLSLSLFFNADMILVRHFFDGTTAGQYLALSTVGRIIFYAVGPVITVMFPLISSRAGSGKEYIPHLMGSLMITLSISLAIIFVYSIFPQLLLNILYGGRYNSVSSFLVLFSFYMTIYAMNSILTYFLVSVSYFRPVYLLFAVALLQSIIIYLVHDSISTIIWINIWVSLLYFLFAAFFVWKRERNVLMKMILKVFPLSYTHRRSIPIESG